MAAEGNIVLAALARRQARQVHDLGAPTGERAAVVVEYANPCERCGAVRVVITGTEARCALCGASA